MSKNEKATEQNTEKVLTKYDRKMQKRAEQKAKEKAEKRRSTIITVVAAILVVAVIAIFPISNYIALNETYATINGEDVKRVEFDYSFSVAYNNYMNTYGSMMSYMGVDLTGDLSAQMYSEELTFKDFFDQMAIENMVQTKALLAEAEAAGFTYDATEDFKNFEASIDAAAAQIGLSSKDYIKAMYGSYATLGRISPYVINDIVAAEFYAQKAEEKTPAAEEIQAHYESYPAEYDSVDYRVTAVMAELPTEPTELADPVDETVSAGDAEAEYQPSEAEIAKAMEEAKKLTGDAEKKVATEGALMTNVTKANMTATIQEWLFDDARKAGDTTVIEDTYNHQYYVLAFEKRYLDESPSADIRIIITEGANGQTVLDEWKNGAATEDSFAELCAQYSIDTSAATGGLMEGVTRSGLSPDVTTWLFEESRAAGDTTAIASEDGTYTYVMYYIGENEPAWKLSIESTLLTNTMNNYIEELMDAVTVEDSNGKLKYLQVEAAVAEAQ